MCWIYEHRVWCMSVCVWMAPKCVWCVKECVCVACKCVWHMSVCGLWVSDTWYKQQPVTHIWLHTFCCLCAAYCWQDTGHHVECDSVIQCNMVLLWWKKLFIDNIPISMQVALLTVNTAGIREDVIRTFWWNVLNMLYAISFSYECPMRVSQPDLANPGSYAQSHTILPTYRHCFVHCWTLTTTTETLIQHCSYILHKTTPSCKVFE